MIGVANIAGDIAAANPQAASGGKIKTIEI
jgi:hypothetical protein